MNEIIRSIEHDKNHAIFMSILAVIVVAMLVASFKARGQTTDYVTPGNGKNEVLLTLNARDVYTVEHLVRGGLAIWGATGSGKTSGTIPLIRSILRRPSSMLVLCSKPGEAQEWLRVTREEGRAKDVIHVHPRSSFRFNMLDYERERCGGIGQAQNMTRFLMNIRTAILREESSIGGDAAYWIRQDERAILMATTLLTLAGHVVNPVSIQRVFTTAPTTKQEIASEKWQAGLCNQLILQAYERNQQGLDHHNYVQACDYFLSEWVNMGEKPRGSILTGVMSVLGVISGGMCHELFFNETNITPNQCLREGKIVLVDLPPDQYGDLGFVANIGWKICWQKSVLAQDINQPKALSVIWGDESSLWLTKEDTDFISRCRSNRGALVYLCQSLPAYMNMLPGDKALSIVNATMANFTHKLFFALGDYETAEWASKHIGQEVQMLCGGSRTSPDEVSWNPFVSPPGSTSMSFNESYQPIIRPEQFMCGMRTGGTENQLVIDGYLLRSGLAFSNGYNVLPITIHQKKSHA